MIKLAFDNARFWKLGCIVETLVIFLNIPFFKGDGRYRRCDGMYI